MKHVDASAPFIYAAVLFGLALFTIVVLELLRSADWLLVTMGVRGSVLVFFPLLAGAVLWWPVVALVQTAEPAGASALGSHLWRCFPLYLLLIGGVVFFARGIQAWPAAAWLMMFSSGSLAGILVDILRSKRTRSRHAAA